MPLKKELRLSKLQLRLEEGLGTDGKMKYSNMTFNRMLESATDEDVQAVGAAIGTLQKKKVALVARVDEAVLTQE